MNNFYVEMDASFMHTMIPKKFAKVFKGSISDIVALEGPSGITWHVKFIRSNDTFALQSGWEEFVISNQIDKNDVLVFIYNGNSSFKVLIFDRSGCEKAAPFFAKNMETETESEELNDCSIQETAAPHREVKKKIISLSSGNSDTDEAQNMETDTESEKSNDCSIQEIGAPHRQVKKEIISRSSGNSDTVESQNMETETESEESNDCLIREIGASHHEVQKEIISLSSGNSDTDEAQNMETETESEESNDCLIRETAVPHRKVKKEITSLSSGNSDTDESSPEISTRAAEARTTARVCCKRKRRDSVQESTESESDKGKHRMISYKGTYCHSYYIASRMVSRLYLIPWRLTLTKAQHEIANMMAQKTKQGSNLFVKVLTPTNIPTNRGCILQLPVGFAGNVLQSSKKDITLLPADLDKRNSVAAYYYCKNSASIYCENRKNKKMRFIREGWREFARINGLKQGDICLFELRKPDKHGNLTMVVHVNHE